MLDRKVVADVLETALSTGGSFAEIFLENTKKNSVLMTNGIVEKAKSGIDYGLGLRVFDGLGAVYAYTNDTSRDNLIKIAKETAGVIKNKKRMIALNFINTEIENKHQIRISPDSIIKSDIISLLHSASEASFLYSDLITQTNESYMDYIQEVLIANSEGLFVTDRRTRTRVSVSAVASSANEKQTNGFSPGAHMGFEFFDNIDMKQLGTDSAEVAVKMLKADFCPSGKMPVIIDNGFGGVIFHEACGHSLEATAVAKKASVFSDKLNQQIASDCVSAVDDGTMKNEWGSQNIDDEGHKTQRNLLIENGKLKSFMIDKLNGLKMGMAATGSSRRESYRYAPTSRMTNTFIMGGKDNSQEIIASTEYGLYAKKMGGGSVQPATGEFNFAVTEGYLIENGKITKPVRGATLIGKGSEVLMNIDKVSDNFSMEQGMCGSISGSIPTNVGQPMIRVKELIVGGRNS